MIKKVVVSHARRTIQYDRCNFQANGDRSQWLSVCVHVCMGVRMRVCVCCGEGRGHEAKNCDGCHEHRAGTMSEENGKKKKRNFYRKTFTGSLAEISDSMCDARCYKFLIKLQKNQISLAFLIYIIYNYVSQAP